MRAERDDARNRLVVAETEKNKALQVQIQTTNEKQAVEQERDDLKSQRDSALARLKCCDCYEHKSPLHAFIPCGHKICALCRVEMPCPRCQVKITGRLQLLN
jgi:hypothetical protein